MNKASSAGRLSRRLSFVLRHDPGSIGLRLDAGGWADVGALLRAFRANGGAFDRATLEAVVAGSDKARFTLSPDGARIRAAQGHSFPVDLGHAPAPPPPVLFHGTARASLDAIFASGGLEPRSRHQVHLSPDVATATKVGARHGKPVVLAVDAAAMHAEGHAFTRADNGVWLVDAVPARFLAFHEEPGAAADPTAPGSGPGAPAPAP